jgi:hypothetical protein
MSETSILAGAIPSTESGIDMVPPGNGFEDNEGGGDRRRLMIIGAVVGLLVLVAAAYLLLHKSGSASDDTFVPTSSHAATAGSTGSSATGAKTATKGATSGSKGSTKGTTATLPKKAKAPQVRDPFKPLVLAPVEGGSGGTTTTTVNAPSNPTTPSNPTSSTPPVTPTQPPVTPTQPTTTTTGKGTTKGAPQWIQLMRVHGDRASFRVGYAQHKFRTFNVQAPKASSARGTVFDKVFALIGIQNGQVTIQIGDDTPFDLSKGISHTV